MKRKYICVIILIILNVGCNKGDSSYKNTFQIANSKNVNIEEAEHFLRDIKNIDIENNNGDTPLMVAVKNNNLLGVQTIIEYSSPDVNRKNKDNTTPLIEAIKIENINIVSELLFQPDIDVNLKDNSLYKNIEAVARKSGNEILLNEIKGKNNIGKTPLMHAIELGNKEIINMLKAHEDIDLNIVTYGYGHINAALEKADVNSPAVKKVMIEKTMEDYINKQSIKIDKLLVAMKDSTISDLEILSKYEREFKNINFQDEKGNTILMHAISENRSDIISEVLKNRNLEINKQNNRGISALTWVATSGKDDVYTLLEGLENIDYNLKDNFIGRTPFLWAVTTKNEKIIDYLLENPKVIKNTQDFSGKTALMIAAENNDIEIFKTLVGSDEFDFYLKDKKGRTIFEYIEKLDNKEFMDLADKIDRKEL